MRTVRLQGYKVTRLQVSFFCLVSCFLSLVSFSASADTIYFNNGTTEKGLIVEEYYDRYVFSTPDGEKGFLKSNIDEIFFDEPYQNNLYIGKRFEDEGNFESALKFYQLSLKSKPDFKEAQDAMKGLEDAKWHFGKKWSYRELKEILKDQLGIGLKKVKEKIVVVIHSRRGGLNLPYYGYEGGLLPGDAIIKCWARPLTYAGLKNASRTLIGLSNTILKVTVERDIRIGALRGLKLFSPLKINMELEGPVVSFVEGGTPCYNAGLRQGDLIVKIDGEDTRYMRLNKLRRKIFHGGSGKIMTIRRDLTVMRKRLGNSNGKNAMWAWHSKEILLSEDRKAELLSFCRDKNIGVLFFQLQYQFIPMGSRHSNVGYQADTVCRLLYETKLRTFLKDAHSQGIVVYALDGAPEFCLEDNHDLVLAQINAIVDFNKKGATQERFDGVHYDNEPYLLPAFHSAMREDVIRQFLALNRKCKDLIMSAGVKLEFGIDIPFWFDEVDDLYKKLIDVCDNIGIMDYRNFAQGPDGIVAHASNELKYASEVKKKVFVGIETSKYPKQKVYFVSILGESEFNKTPGLMRLTRYEGFSLRVHPYDKKLYLGLAKPEGVDEGNFKKALGRLANAYGKISKPEDKERLDKFIFDAAYAISTNPELRNAQAQEYGGAGGRAFLMFTADEAMLEKLTFADMTEGDLNNTMADARKEFKDYPGFAGFAIHHYKSYKELCEKK